MQYYYEIDLAKGFAIILAVFGHAAPDAVKGFWIVGNCGEGTCKHDVDNHRLFGSQVL